MTDSDPNRFNRDGMSTIAQISSFLGGLFFSALLLLIQNKRNYDVPLYDIIPFSKFQIVAYPLTISIILFVLTAIFYAFDCVSDEQCNRETSITLSLFPYGFLSFFVSFVLVLFIADELLGIIGGVVIFLLVLWSRTK